MQPSVHSKSHASRTSGFSLVEISLALAIVAVALIALVGMLPSGMSNFRAAMDVQTAGEIFQRVVADAQETDFDTLLASKVESGGTAAQFYRLALRHFDEQGTEVKVANPDAPTSLEAKAILYTVRVRGTLPGDPDPRNHSDNFATSLPGFAAPRFNPRDVTFLTVQVAGTGGTRQISPLVDPASFLISPSLAAKTALSVRTYAAIVARNGYRKQP
jgi:uncharacterized protein (TIGR02598 family)